MYSVLSEFFFPKHKEDIVEGFIIGTLTVDEKKNVVCHPDGFECRQCFVCLHNWTLALCVCVLFAFNKERCQQAGKAILTLHTFR